MYLWNTFIMIELIISIMNCHWSIQVCVIVVHYIYAISMHLSFKKECQSMTNLLCWTNHMHRMDFSLWVKIDQMLVEYRTYKFQLKPLWLVFNFMKDTFSKKKSKVKCAQCQNILKIKFSLYQFLYLTHPKLKLWM